MSERLALHRLQFPLGELQAVTRNDVLCALTFVEYWPQMQMRLARRFRGAALDETADGGLQRRLDRYLAGRFDAFDEVAVDPGGTAFQRAVWDALRRVPAGATTSYGALARAIGSPNASRAVGAANGANPIWLVIPCHRAIGANGTLTGYAGGLDRKAWLLKHEQAAGVRTGAV